MVGAVSDGGSGRRQSRAHHCDVDGRALREGLNDGQHSWSGVRGSVTVIEGSWARLRVYGGHVDVQDPARHHSFLPTSSPVKETEMSIPASEILFMPLKVKRWTVLFWSRCGLAVRR